MKRILVLLAVLAVFAFVLACVSQPRVEPVKATPVPATPVPTPPPPPPPQIIEHKTSDFGGQVPDWLTKTVLEMEKESEFKDYYVFIIDEPGGKSLQGLKTYAENFDRDGAVAQMVSTRVKSKFVGALAGDIDMVESYMEKVVKSVAEAEFSGMRTVEDFWVKKRYFTNTGDVEKEEFRYLMLVTVPRKAINDAINRALDGNKPETKEEKSAVDRVKEAWGDGM